MVIILPLWLLNKNRIKRNDKKLLFKVFIKDCYFLGWFLLLTQMPLNLLTKSLFYSLYELICMGFMCLSLCFYNRIRFKNNNCLTPLVIFVLFYITLSIILLDNSFYIDFINNKNQLLNEFIINIIVRGLQFLFILILFGGRLIMLKGNLIKHAKKNLGKTVASTSRLVGEPKLSNKLKAEVKNSK